MDDTPGPARGLTVGSAADLCEHHRPGHPDDLLDVVRRGLPATRTTCADEVVGRLATGSAHLMLDPATRAVALQQVRAGLPDDFELDATTGPSLARRVPA